MKKSQKRRSKKQKTYKKKAKGGDKVVKLVAYESPTRPKHPEYHLFITSTDNKGSAFQVEDYLSELSTQVENYLVALKMNREKVKLPKQAIVKGMTIVEPVYVPPQK